MPQLLRDIVCVIETFRRYAREDSGKATLTHRELKQLLDSELGGFLQPHVFRAVERNLNLLDIDRNGTISFEEFVLTIFSLLKLCYLDIQSLLNSEARQASNTEKTNYVGPGAIIIHGQPIMGTLPDQEMMSSTQLSHEEGEAVGHPVSPWEDKTPNLPGEAFGPRDSKNQHLEEDEREVTQDVPASEDDGAQFKTNQTLEGSKRTSSLIEEIPREEDKPPRRPSNTQARDQFEEDNLELEKERAQRPSDDQEVAAERGIKKRSKAQVPLLSREDKATAERTDLPQQDVTRKPPEAQKLAEPVEDNRACEIQEPGPGPHGTLPRTTSADEPDVDRRTSETHELSAQEKQHEPSDQPAQNSSRNSSEKLSIHAEREEERIPEAQKQHQRKTQPPGLEAQTQDGKYQKPQGPAREQETGRGSNTQTLSSEEGNQNHSEIDGKETRRAENGTEDTFVISKNSPPAEAAPGARERRQASSSREQTPGESIRATRPHDIPGAQKQGAPESSRAQKVEVGGIQEEDVHLPEEQEPPSGQEHKGPGLGAKGGPGAAMEPDGHPETYKSTEGGQRRKSPQAESSRGLDADFPDQTSEVKLPGKRGSKKEPRVQDAEAKEKDEVPEDLEAILKNPGEGNTASPTAYHGKGDPATLEEEDECPQDPSEVDDQRGNE